MLKLDAHFRASNRRVGCVFEGPKPLHHGRQRAFHLFNDLFLGAQAAISACGAHAAWPHALQLLRLSPRDVVSYNAAMSACTRGRQIRRALELFETMKFCHLKADSTTLGAVLHARLAGFWSPFSPFSGARRAVYGPKRSRCCPKGPPWCSSTAP